MNDEIVQKIAVDLNIKQGLAEPVDKWQARVLYSYFGLNMLAAAYDHDDIAIIDNKKSKADPESDGIQNVSVSIQHILTRGKELANIFEFDYSDAFFKYIQELYVASGYLLHLNNRLTYPSCKAGTLDGNIYLTRGQMPWNVHMMSGLGSLSLQTHDEIMPSWEDMFNIMTKPIMEWFTEFEKTICWTDCSNIPSNIEYANITKKSTYGYWQNNLDTHSLILCREKNNFGQQQYWLLDLAKRNAIYGIPDWRVDNLEYLRILLALRIQANNFPVVKVQQMGNIARVVVDILMPPYEQNFFELYSWPNIVQSNLDGLDARLNRIVSWNVWPYFEIMFARLGFKITYVNFGE